MSTLTKEQLFAAAAAKIGEVNIDALGGSVRLRSLTRGTRKQWLSATAAGDPDAMDVLIVESLLEPKLSRADIKSLNEMDEKATDAIVSAISDFNGWGESGDDEERRKILTGVADGEVSVDDALARFRAGA